MILATTKISLSSTLVCRYPQASCLLNLASNVFSPLPYFPIINILRSDVTTSTLLRYGPTSTHVQRGYGRARPSMDTSTDLEASSSVPRLQHTTQMQELRRGSCVGGGTSGATERGTSCWIYCSPRGGRCPPICPLKFLLHGHVDCNCCLGFSANRAAQQQAKPSVGRRLSYQRDTPVKPR